MLYPLWLFASSQSHTPCYCTISSFSATLTHQMLARPTPPVSASTMPPLVPHRGLPCSCSCSYSDPFPLLTPPFFLHVSSDPLFLPLPLSTPAVPCITIVFATHVTIIDANQYCIGAPPLTWSNMPHPPRDRWWCRHSSLPPTHHHHSRCDDLSDNLFRPGSAVDLPPQPKTSNSDLNPNLDPNWARWIHRVKEVLGVFIGEEEEEVTGPFVILFD